MAVFSNTLTIQVESPTLTEDTFIKKYVDRYVKSRLDLIDTDQITINAIGHTTVSTASQKYNFQLGARVANISTVTYPLTVTGPIDTFVIGYIEGLFNTVLKTDPKPNKNDKYTILSATVT